VLIKNHVDEIKALTAALDAKLAKLRKSKNSNDVLTWIFFSDRKKQ